MILQMSIPKLKYSKQTDWFEVAEPPPSVAIQPPYELNNYTLLEQ